MAFETILTERRNNVLVITLNRPERLNAAPPQMFDEIGQALDNLNGARCVLITGAGRAFCSGADLAARSKRTVSDGEGSYQVLTQSYNPTMLKLARLNVPVVTAVNGPAAGGGCSLALASDFCVAGESAYFLQAFVNIGLVPDCGASWMLAKMIGKTRAAEMLLLGERISATKAAEWGLIHKCVPDATLQDEALSLASRLAAGPTLALGLMRQALAQALESTYEATLLCEAESQRIAAGSSDASEGGKAFLEKRQPVFSGR